MWVLLYLEVKYIPEIKMVLVLRYSISKEPKDLLKWVYQCYSNRVTYTQKAIQWN